MNRCALCGRVTLNPAVMIGQHPVGPKCAKRAGLLSLAQRRIGMVYTAGPGTAKVKRDQRTLELFPEAA